MGIMDTQETQDLKKGWFNPGVKAGFKALF